MKYFQNFISAMGAAAFYWVPHWLYHKQVRSLGLLDLVENDRVSESEEYQARVNDSNKMQLDNRKF